MSSRLGSGRDLMARKKLGELLIEAGVIDQDALRSALSDQRRWGRSLGRTLVELRLISEADLVDVLAKQLGLTSVNLDQLQIPAAVIELVPPELAIRHQVVPFAQPMKFLDLAMADPANLSIVDELRIRTRLNPRAHLAGPRMIDRALARYYNTRIAVEVPVEVERPDTLASAPRRAERSSVAITPAGERAGRQRFAPGPHPVEVAPQMPSVDVPGGNRDAEIDALQARLARLEALVERDEEILRKLFALLIDKGVATREEILASIR
jgi:hypothetical protein